MKKTLTVNLNAQVFHIDDDAYEVLDQYLSHLKGHFKGQEGEEEILSDIEARLAELFQERLRYGMQVVSLREVNDVISIMGKPGEIDQDSIQMDEEGEPSDNESETQPQPEKEIKTEKISRKFYRDGDNRLIGGVLAGMAKYFGMDVVLLRILYVLFFFLGGIGFWIYIILWIIVPEARTAAQKLEMEGEQVTIDNLKQKVVEEMERGDYVNKSKSVWNSFRNGFNGAFRGLSSCLGCLLGIIVMPFIIIGIIALIGGMTTLINGGVAGVPFLSMYGTGSIWQVIVAAALILIPAIIFIVMKAKGKDIPNVLTVVLILIAFVGVWKVVSFWMAYRWNDLFDYSFIQEFSNMEGWNWELFRLLPMVAGSVAFALCIAFVVIILVKIFEKANKKINKDI